MGDGELVAVPVPGAGILDGGGSPCDCHPIPVSLPLGWDPESYPAADARQARVESPNTTWGEIERWL